MKKSTSTKVFAIDGETGGLYDSPNQTGSPERNLLMAVLERAILDLVGNDEQESSEAKEWIFNDLCKPEFSAFSFPWLCQELDLNYRDIADTISRIPKRGNSRIAPWYVTKHYVQKAAS
jgi:hypothetical protein